MTSSVDLSPPRRPIFFPVVIATVFLTIIGMTGGFALGERHRREVRNTASLQPTHDSPVNGPTTSSPAAATLCPPETRDTAAQLGFASDLRQVLKIVTDNGTTVWICQDEAANLYYQGKTGGTDKPLIQGDNGLFLSDVTRQATDQYEAIAANGNRIDVSRKSLVVHFKDGRTQANSVRYVE